MPLRNNSKLLPIRVGLAAFSSAAARMTGMPIETAGPTTLDSVRRTLESYSDNPSAFLALNSGNRYFTRPGLDGVVVYRSSGRHLVQFGGPFAPAGCYGRLLEA